jgi:RNA polymerase-binding transcription factor DksA
VDTTRAHTLLDAERRRLKRWRDELNAERADMDAEGTGELSTIDQHLADSASDTAERDRIMSLLVTVDDALAEVADAAHRLDAGHFGRCASCGIDIPDERLEAVPATRFCREHQGYWEVTHPVLHPPGGPIPEDHGIDVEELMMARWGGRSDALPDDDRLGELDRFRPALEELDTEDALQEERHGY